MLAIEIAKIVRKKNKANGIANNGMIAEIIEITVNASSI